MEHKEQWANNVFASIEGIKRASPTDVLFTKINSKLNDLGEVKIIPLSNLGWAAAAACIMIALNIFALSNSVEGGNDKDFSKLYKTQILTDFSIYE